MSCIDRTCPTLSAFCGGCDMQLSWTQRIVGFLMCFVFGIFMLFMTFTAIPSLLLGGFVRFGTTFAFANISLLASTFFLVGPKQQLSSMFAKGRAVISTVYVMSLLLTIYEVFWMPKWWLVGATTAVAFVCLVLYVISHIPWFGGSANAATAASSAILGGLFGRRSLLPL